MTTHLLYGPTPYYRKGWHGYRGRKLKLDWFAETNDRHAVRATRAWCRVFDGGVAADYDVAAVTCAQCQVLLDTALERGDVEVTGELPRVRYVRPLTEADYRRAALPLEFRRVP